MRHDEQISGEAVGEVTIVSDIHERKAEMTRRVDAFIALPGLHLLSSSHFLLMFHAHPNFFLKKISIFFKPFSLRKN